MDTRDSFPVVETLAVVGLGLIGGSMARDARRHGFARRLLGVETDAARARRAVDLGLVDETLPLEEVVPAAGLTVVAVPVDAAVRLLPAVLDLVADPGTITDVCSTKRGLIEAVRGHPKRARYVGGHPMAGTENSGPEAALEGLFEGRVGILCDVADSAADARACVETLYRCLGMRMECMEAAQHDMHAAYVSHISHVISYALALTVLDKEKDERQIFNLAAGGFASTARLAKSAAGMWVPIFLDNRDNVLTVLDTYQAKLEALRDAIDRRDVDGLHALIDAANDIRRVLR